MNTFKEIDSNSNFKDSQSSSKDQKSVIDELENFWEENDERYRDQKRGIISSDYIMQQ